MYISDESTTLDPPAARDIARRLAEESVVLLANDGTLPLRDGLRVALVGPQADAVSAMLGCYTFPSHVGALHPDAAPGVAIPTLRDALAGEDVELDHVVGCSVDGADTAELSAAVAAAERADVCVVALGDRAGLFGRGTSGEGCDLSDLRLPGVQAALLDAVLATGTPVVLVLLTGRPYALGDFAGRSAAIVQAFPFGHGLSYSDFTWSGVAASAVETGTDGEVIVAVTVTNTGSRAGAEVVQLYLHDPVAQVTRPVVRLIGYAKVRLAAGASARVSFRVPAAAAAFTGRAGHRVVEPGELSLRLATSSTAVRATVPVRLVGPELPVEPGAPAVVAVTVA
ncbi:MAG: glycoside hydrolase family 3 C-terminal domain-containing protein [Actinophytocola sp.]|uniref:glycoside hydrolase family 3 C-terminal domain-containing protein n=1 Tax=Actinophytocola sp. TaxID=1872138 RepID=UPI003D6C5B93